MIGKLIKVIAVIFLAIGLVASLLGGLYVTDYDGPTGLILALGGIVFSIIFFAMLYGYGVLIDTNTSIDEKMDRLLAYMKQAPRAPQAPAYQPPVQPAAPAYQPPVRPVYQPPVQPPVQPAPAAKPQPVVQPEPVVHAPVVQPEPAAKPEPIVADTPATGWKCSNCGAEYPVLTAFCRSCGNKRI